MITPPLSISARPLLTLMVPRSAIKVILASALEAAEDVVHLVHRGGHRPEQHSVLLHSHHVVDVRTEALRRETAERTLDSDRVIRALAEGDRQGVARLERPEPTVRGSR